MYFVQRRVEKFVCSPVAVSQLDLVITLIVRPVALYVCRSAEVILISVLTFKRSHIKLIVSTSICFCFQ